MIRTGLKRASSSRRLALGVLGVAMTVAGIPTPGLAGAPGGSVTPGAARCGNHAVEAGEECDDGGVCIGGANAGEGCTSDDGCQGEGVCIGGDKELFACVDAADCPGSQCVRCKTFGGGGCASNCTNETDVSLDLIPGVVQNTTPLSIAVGTSGAVVHSDPIVFPLPLSGTQGLAMGKERNGIIPLALKVDGVNIPRIEVGSAQVCACVRAVAQKRCGGVVYNRDGTLSPDCTDGFTDGPSVCPPEKRCAFVFGDDNAGAGLISCAAGLQGVDFTVTQDAGGPSRISSAPQVVADGTGPAGSVILFNTLATGIVRPACTGFNPDYGDDHQFCTSDDPQSARGLLGPPARATTGTASGMVLNANAEDGNDIGPFIVQGQPVDCQALATGRIEGGLASAFTQIDAPGVNGDAVVTAALFARVEAQTPTPTPTGATPTPSPTPPQCPGDCNHDGAVVASELLDTVKVALGAATLPTCDRADTDLNGAVSIDEVVGGIVAAQGPCAAVAVP